MLPIRYLTTALLLLVAASAARAEVIGIDNARLQQLMEQGVAVVDIRREDEWRATGVIDNSHLLTFFDAQGRYDAPDWHRKLDSIIAADEPVILVCRSGQRTALVSRWLSDKPGFATVYHLAGGLQEWTDAGGQTVAAP